MSINPNKQLSPDKNSQEPPCHLGSIAIVHDWLTTYGGAERVLSAILELYPAPLYTLIKDPKLCKERFKELEIHTSFLQKLPGSIHYFRHLLPLFPLAIEQFDLSGYDVVISSSHAVAKGALTHHHQLHICYCYTPMRYAWDLTHRYLEGLGFFKRQLARGSLHYLRNWDIASLNRVDHFIADSHFVAKRIKKIYGTEASVIYPPVDTELIQLTEEKEDFYLTVSRLVPYKKIDLIVEAFGQLPEKKLVVIGSGPELKSLQRKSGKNIEFLENLPDFQVRLYLQKARAFIFAAEEDFGIAPVEAQAAGTPVIAFGRGGALETVKEGVTGVFFYEQMAQSLLQAIKQFEKLEFDPRTLRKHAEGFSKERFQSEFSSFVKEKREAAEWK